jgi:hypothetical protein
MECRACRGSGWLADWRGVLWDRMYTPHSAPSAGLVPCRWCGGTGKDADDCIGGTEEGANDERATCD